MKRKIDRRLLLIPLVIPVVPIICLGMAIGYIWQPFLLGFELTDMLFRKLHQKLNKMNR